MEKNPERNPQCKAITLRSQRNVRFALSSSFGSKKEVPFAEDAVQAPTGSTEDDDEGTEPPCQEEGGDTAANAGCQAPKGERADQDGDCYGSESEDSMPGRRLSFTI